MTRLTRVGLMALGLAATTMSAATARADDFVAGGFKCRLNAPVGFDGALFPLNISEVQNVSSSFTDVVCPAVNTSAGANVKAVINTSLSSQWTNRNCNFFGNTFDGQTSFSFPTMNLTQVGQSFQFAQQAGSNHGFFNFVSFAFLCSVPPGESIFKYEVQHL